MGLLKELRKISIFRRGSQASTDKTVDTGDVVNHHDCDEHTISKADLAADKLVPTKGDRRQDGGALLLSEAELSRMQCNSSCSTAVSSTCDGDLQTTLATSTALDLTNDDCECPAVDRHGELEELLPVLQAATVAEPAPERPVKKSSKSSLKAQEIDAKRQMSEESDGLNFDKPLEQIYQGISEAFGHMIATSLRSTKWDKRSQALKGMATVLKGLDLRGMAPPGSTGALGKGLTIGARVRCWRLACELLNHTMKEKVMPVRLAAHDLFVDAFSNTDGIISQEEIDTAGDVLMEHLVDRLGDSNLRLHESARKCVLFCANQPGFLGLGRVLSKLRSRLTNKKSKAGDRTKVHFGVLDTVNFLLMHFPGRRAGVASDEMDDEAPSSGNSWMEQDVREFILAGMDDSLGERVKGSATALAVTVYQTFGMEAMQPLLEKLRPAKQDLLKQACQQAEEAGMGYDGDEDGDGAEIGNSADFADLVVCGTGMKPPSGGVFLPPLNGAPAVPNAADDEEFLMDGILEDTGMVFGGGASLTQEGFGNFRHLSPIQSRGGLGPGRHAHAAYADDEQRLLEEELLQMGIMDLEEGLDEQQALLDSLAEGSCEDSSPEGFRRGTDLSPMNFDQCLLEEVF